MNNVVKAVVVDFLTDEELHCMWVDVKDLPSFVKFQQSYYSKRKRKVEIILKNL